MIVHSSSSSQSPIEMMLFLLIGGPAVVGLGLKKLFQMREIENTPTSRIRSAAVGKIELSGLAKMRSPMKSPLSHLDCCWWICHVQELQQKGKSSDWVTIKTTGLKDLFYLDDPTGRVMVNPLGAEITALKSTFNLGSATRSQFAPLLESWGVGMASGFGLGRPMRIVEECLPDCAPVYVLGEITPVKDHIADRDARFRTRIRQLKENPDAMQTADRNQDGTVDAAEWDALVLQQKDQFVKDELARLSDSPTEEMMIVRAPQHGSFIISTGVQSDVIGRFRWKVPLSLLGGVSMSAGGVYWALAQHWPVFAILGCLVGGLLVSFVLNQKGVSVWSLF